MLSCGICTVCPPGNVILCCGNNEDMPCKLIVGDTGAGATCGKTDIFGIAMFRGKLNPLKSNPLAIFIYLACVCTVTKYLHHCIH